MDNRVKIPAGSRSRRERVNQGAHVLLSTGYHPYDGVPDIEHIFSYGSRSGWKVSSGQKKAMIKNITGRTI